MEKLKLIYIDEDDEQYTLEAAKKHWVGDTLDEAAGGLGGTLATQLIMEDVIDKDMISGKFIEEV